MSVLLQGLIDDFVVDFATGYYDRKICQCGWLHKTGTCHGHDHRHKRSFPLPDICGREIWLAVALFVNVGGKLGANYEVTFIDPSVSETRMENLIALCPTCYSKYITGRKDEQVQRLLHIKKNLVDDYEAKETVSMQKVEDGIRKVLEKIPKMQVPANIDLNYNPVTLRQKIATDNLMLYLKAKTNVNVYYNAVQEAFTELNAERVLRYKPFCLQVRMTYVNLSEMGLSQDEIFEKMVDWLQDATHENRSSCEVIISYFIQKCEVFDVITE